MIRPPAVAALLLLSVGPVRAQQDEGDTAPMVVTTDTSAYCLRLWQQIHAHAPLPREVRELQSEGMDLCNGGQVRGGINRLRRALMMLRAGHEAPGARAQDVADPPKPAAPGPHP